MKEIRPSDAQSLRIFHLIGAEDAKLGYGVEEN